MYTSDWKKWLVEFYYVSKLPSLNFRTDIKLMKKMIRIINTKIILLYIAHLFSNKIHEITKLMYRTWLIDSCIAVFIIAKIIIMTYENRTKYM